MNRRSFPTRTLIAACATAAALAAPAVASATDRWVDTDTGTNSGNSCTVQANPCKTIQQASDTSQIAGNFGTIHVDQGTYTEDINIAQGNHVTADDFVTGDSGPTVITNTGSGVTVYVQATASISGFQIVSDSPFVVVAADNASVHDNTITAKTVNSTAVQVSSTGGSPSVIGNTIIADSGDEDVGVSVEAGTGRATISANTIGEAAAGFARGVSLKPGARASLEGNTILGTREDGAVGNGIRVDGADDVSIVDNDIRQPVTTPGDDSYGVYAVNLAPSDSLSLERNRIVGMTDTGIALGDVAGTVTSSNDIVAGSSDRSVYAGNAPDVTFTNDTIIAGNSAPVVLNTAHLTVDSSILDVPITTDGGTVTCSIAYSRGPAIVEGGNGCGEFQTTADPQFVDRFASPVPDLELKPTSPLLDEGNPADPGAGVLDNSGDARVVESDGECPHEARRDMGAEELAPTLADCPVVEPPAERDTTAPDSGIVGKKKQHGHKARFKLTSTEDGSTFECKLDRGKFVPCDASFRSRKLNFGRHTLFVRATDAAGNTDQTPAAKKFKLKR